ncbi:pentapeptide repeat-containing protein [Roseofilum sp. Guam]|uniref:pentapeptide repeat-containing protein n=1 Tax=Roseofilum sp. Guam TaxID=2821502 RepID=UPI001B26DFF5|nr:pentapeptide repeat-containing protein [Roseofilum sp. Guam]MBP0027154.1 pentapeptide repeat-containing protein [Roseofilum sp. Guam]
MTIYSLDMKTIIAFNHDGDIFLVRDSSQYKRLENWEEMVDKKNEDNLVSIEDYDPKRIVASIQNWTELKQQQKQGEYQLSNEDVAGQVYDLFGVGRLTPKIVEYVLRLLMEIETFDYLALFQRLQEVYYSWCAGDYIDAPPNKNYPLKKMLALQERMADSQLALGLRQIDVYTGLNVTILLLELHRYGQDKAELRDKIKFYPCGQLNNDGKLEDSTKLLRIIGYSSCVGVLGFLNIVGTFLAGVNLSAANLSGVNLSGANLKRANFKHANLIGADLSCVNLSDAGLKDTDLKDTDLRGAELKGANLSGANLKGANLGCTNLSGANLSRANLDCTNLSGANLSRANFSRVNLVDVELIEACLSGANLSRANLSGTNLSCVNLSRANLSGTNLSDANLKGTNLSGANLNGAILNRTNLSGANLRGANLNGAILNRTILNDEIWGDICWDERTQWEGLRGLKTAINIPDQLKQELGLAN